MCWILSERSLMCFLFSHLRKTLHLLTLRSLRRLRTFTGANRNKPTNQVVICRLKTEKVLGNTEDRGDCLQISSLLTDNTLNKEIVSAHMCWTNFKITTVLISFLWGSTLSKPLSTWYSLQWFQIRVSLSIFPSILIMFPHFLKSPLPSAP